MKTTLNLTSHFSLIFSYSINFFIKAHHLHHPLPLHSQLSALWPVCIIKIENIIHLTFLEFYRNEEANLDDPLIYHRLIEIQKFAYAQRTKLGIQ